MFRQDCTCPALLFVLHALVLSCTGLSPAMARLSRLFHWDLRNYKHWAVPLSLATTDGISVDFYSSGY
jgi:hypothetical protein